MQLEDLALASDSLIVFVLGVNLPPTCEGSGEDPAPTLRSLAESTGGRFVRLKSTDGLGGAFAELRESLGEERYVLYEPLPFGEGPRDDAAKQSGRWRRLKRGSPFSGR